MPEGSLFYSQSCAKPAIPKLAAAMMGYVKVPLKLPGVFLSLWKLMFSLTAGIKKNGAFEPR